MEKRILKVFVGGFIAVAIAVSLIWVQVAHSDDGEPAPALAGSIATSAAVPNVSVYRLYNPASSEHLYTADSHERDVLAVSGWNDEGIGWYAPREGGAGVYRLYNPSSGDHLFTTDTNECATLTNEYGWQMDNNGRPLFNSGGDTPILRLFFPSTGAHLITKDLNEYSVLGNSGWTPEGIKLYALSGDHSATSWPMGSSDIANVASQASIEGTVRLAGAGSGYQAMLEAKAGAAAVRFGLRYDTGGSAPYNATTSLVIENIVGGQPTTQKVVYAGYGETNKAYRLLMTVQREGIVDCYLNGERIKSVRNANLANQVIQLAVDGAGKNVGDNVTATFNDIVLKTDGVYQGMNPSLWQPVLSGNGSGLTGQFSSFPSEVTIGGTVTALTDPATQPSIYRGVGAVTFTPVAPLPEPTPEPEPTPDPAPTPDPEPAPETVPEA